MAAATTLAPPHISEIEEDPVVIKLSPHAPEFHPTYSPPSEPEEQEQLDPLHLCIFNEGVPSLVLASESDVTNLLHGIPDEALDESFPPTAQEAAELETVEEFVDMMASLAYMEEREERARISFDHVQKRWESRRAEGLVGRPRPAKHNVEPVLHHGAGARPSVVQGGGGNAASNSAMVAYEHHAHRMLMKHQKLHQKELDMRAKHLSNRKLSSSNAGGKQRHGIQQPRKQL